VDLTGQQPMGSNEEFVLIRPTPGEPIPPGWQPPSPPYISSDGTYYAYAGRRLPTYDMIRKALPEGVLREHARATGFVYFPSLPANTSWASLTFAIVRPRSGAHLGTVEVPLVAQP
jgi:hypothetical protein